MEKTKNDALLTLVSSFRALAISNSQPIDSTGDLASQIFAYGMSLLDSLDDSFYCLSLSNDEKQEFEQFISSLSQYWTELEMKPLLEDKLLGLTCSFLAHIDTMKYHIESKSLPGENLAGNLFVSYTRKAPTN